MRNCLCHDIIAHGGHCVKCRVPYGYYSVASVAIRSDNDALAPVSAADGVEKEETEVYTSFSSGRTSSRINGHDQRERERGRGQLQSRKRRFLCVEFSSCA